ncbi:ribbon-helix-helix domain-containing protein [Candidatus Woesearchaeota archaeon]|nr:ribbon-helix-helix domain-containing protein [Candidatus Woesearchaeota archaeon]
MTQPPSNNSLVSVRMPKSLFSELQSLTEKNHYLDVSEQVRSIVREKWMEAKEPQAYQLRKLRKDIAEAVKSSTEEKAQQQLIKELERIKEGLLGDRPK